METKTEITLNYKIEKKSIDDSFSVILKDYLTDGLDISLMGFDFIVKISQAFLDFQGKQVLTVLPLQIVLSKETFLTDIDVEGLLELTFISKIDLKQNWQVFTSTSLEYFEWREKPKLSIGVFNFGIETISNVLIEKNKDNLILQIDKSIHEQFSPKRHVLNKLEKLFLPFYLKDLLGSYLLFSTELIGISEFKRLKSHIQGQIFAGGELKLTNSMENDLSEDMQSSLPMLDWLEDAKINSTLRLPILLSFADLNNYLNSNYKGQTFKFKDKEIQLESIHLDEKEGVISISADVSKDINGTIHLMGNLQFNTLNQQLSITNLQLDIKVSNVLQKVGVLIFKRKLEREASKFLHFSIKENIHKIQQKLDAELRIINERTGVTSNVEILSFCLEEIHLYNGKVEAFLNCEFYFELVAEDISILEAFNLDQIK